MTRTVLVAADGPLTAQRALEHTIGSGGVAVFPADGLYGIACDPGRPDAIARIHALKGRDDGKPAAVMFFAPLAMREVLSNAGPRTRDALGALLPGPVTAVIANPARLYPLACREDAGRLGIRLIEGPLAGARCAIFQTSANRSGEPATGSFGELNERIVAGADLAIDGGELTGAPSTVVDLTGLDADGGWSLLREGALSEAAVGERLRSAGVA